MNGPLVTSELTDDVSNGVDFLANRPAFSAYSTGAASLSAGGTASIILDTEYFDSWSGHQSLGTASAYPQRYFCQAPGWYIAEGFVPFNYTGTVSTVFAASLGVTTGGTFASRQGQMQVVAAGETPGPAVADLIQMTRSGPVGSASTDYVQLQALTSGSGISLQGGPYPTLSVRWQCTGSASALPVPSNGTFPVPPSYLGTAWANENIRDTVGFLANPPALRVSYTPGSQQLSSGTWSNGSTISLNTVSLDNYSAFSASTSLWTAPCAGIHYIIGQVATLINTVNSGNYAAGISVSGTQYWGDSVYIPHVVGTVVTSSAGRYRLNQGDTVALIGFTGASGAVNVLAATRLVVAFEGS